MGPLALACETNPWRFVLGWDFRRSHACLDPRKSTEGKWSPIAFAARAGARWWRGATATSRTRCAQPHPASGGSGLLRRTMPPPSSPLSRLLFLVGAMANRACRASPKRARHFKVSSAFPRFAPLCLTGSTAVAVLAADVRKADLNEMVLRINAPCCVLAQSWLPDRLAQVSKCQ